ncbi:hypothetical protein E4U14_005071 [Claviceps sp. LM454 group G7]|nr:hypothetical protein E4U14_005071 [Claviceps sp. LM454 group G7]
MPGALGQQMMLSKNAWPSPEPPPLSRALVASMSKRSSRRRPRHFCRSNAGRGSNARQNAVFEPQCHASNTIVTENLNKSVEKPVQKALRTPSPGAASWASITARSVSGRSWFFGAAQPPLPLDSSPPASIQRSTGHHSESPETLGDTKT